MKYSNLWTVFLALDLSVPTMLENEICELVAAPRFAYGTLGRYYYKNNFNPLSGSIPPLLMDTQITMYCASNLPCLFFTPACFWHRYRCFEILLE